MTARHPIRIGVTDDFRRSRFTVLLRLILALPHFLWAAIWSLVILPLIVFEWIHVSVAGHLEDDVHAFLTRYTRYVLHVTAYALLFSNPWPSFNGRRGYPVDVEIDEAERQRRLTVLFRLIFGIPAIVFASVLATATTLLSVFAWFAALATGRMPAGMEELGTYCLRYVTQTHAYLLLLTSRYPALAGATTGDD